MPAITTAPTPQNYSNLVDTLTAQAFLSTVLDGTMALRIFTETLKMRGRINSDNLAKWREIRMKVGEFTAGYRTDGATRTFARPNHFVPYAIPNADGYEVTDGLTEGELMYLRGPNAIKKAATDVLTRMGMDLGKGLNKELLQQNGTANTVAGVAAFANAAQVPIYGLPTLFGYGATAASYDPVAQASTGNASTASLEVLPNVTYCNVSTHPTNAIAGVDGKRNESTSPVILNHTSSSYGTTGSNSWAFNCLDVIDAAILRVSRANTPEDTPNLGILTKPMFTQVKNKIRTSTTQMVILGDDKPRAVDAGFYPRLSFPWNGVNYFYDDDCPANIHYTLNTNKITLSIFDHLVAGTGDGPAQGTVPNWVKIAQMPDIDTGGWKIVAKIVPQMFIEPRYQAMSYSAA